MLRSCAKVSRVIDTIRKKEGLKEIEIERVRERERERERVLEKVTENQCAVKEVKQADRNKQKTSLSRKTDRHTGTDKSTEIKDRHTGRDKSTEITDRHICQAGINQQK